MSSVLHLAVEGANGSYWPFHSAEAASTGVVLGMKPEKIWETPRSTRWTQGAFTEKAEYGGDKVDMMTIVLSVHISMRPGSPWEQVYSEFRRAWDFDEVTTLVAGSSSGVRRLGVRLVETPEFEPDVDPGYDNYGLMIITCRPEWPFWVEDDVIDVWQSASGALSGSFWVSNPTNRPMHPKYVVDMAQAGTVTLPDFSWVSDPKHEDYEHRDRTITTPSLAAGEQLTIDSYPDELTWRSNINPVFIGRTAGIEFEFAVPHHTPLTQIPVSASVPGATVALRQSRHWTTILGGE
ncbi:hypothetical protein [Rhodococcus sp. 1168]|uniref:hypothetical protein n=1 Tax=Rhodococcus sp. 1168 TaxID=2018041 RepID=UPI000A0A87C1|nr:hypothetical protein [Rhodococcus sp. 1168]ORI13424.1 hypothetical protein BJI47_22535 [Rhodococcus sp. 1168]